MALLLDRRGDQITITDGVLETAARNEDNGEGMIVLLLDYSGDHITITDQVLETAAGNRWHGKEVMALLLDRYRDQIIITDEVVKATVGNKENGKDLNLLQNYFLEQKERKKTLGSKTLMPWGMGECRYWIPIDPLSTIGPRDPTPA
jgi:hypothetical protein